MSDEPRKTGMILIDSAVAVAAIVISLASLWVALREGHTQERLLAASTWPYLQYGSADIAPATGTRQIDFTLQNAGVGPAIVHWADFYYDGKAYANGHDVLAACCAARGNLPTITQGLREVLIAGQSVPFLHLPKLQSDAELYRRLAAVRRYHFYVRACYCSTLDDCWLYDSRSQQHQPVNGCPSADLPEWNG